MKRINSFAVAILLVVSVMIPPSHATQENQFTATDLEIALLLEHLSDAIGCREKLIASGVAHRDADDEFSSQAQDIVSDLDRLAGAKHLIKLLDSSITGMLNKGLGEKHPRIRRLRLMIEALNAAKPNGEQPGTGQPATRPESKPEGGAKPQPEVEVRSR